MYNQTLKTIEMQIAKFTIVFIMHCNMNKSYLYILFYRRTLLTRTPKENNGFNLWRFELADGK